jgi:redox-sensitive bicupin YhaK (pirin superfamily)
MSVLPCTEPSCGAAEDAPDVELEIAPRARSISAFTVGRLLPSGLRRSVGPFVFLDHMGVDLQPEMAADIPPHPHIGLATVTYLFQGAMDHRDSLGSHQLITPGAVNWMTAGRGIAHSERMPPDQRLDGGRLEGIQLWVALPDGSEEAAPEFHHHPASSLPTFERDDVRLRLLAGTAFGTSSPVKVFSPLFYVEANLPPGAVLPLPSEQRERGVLVVQGALTCGPHRFETGRLLILRPGSSPRLTAHGVARVMMMGGESVGRRHVWWNFVSSSKARIEQAKLDWKEHRFVPIPGDETERVELPD